MTLPHLSVANDMGYPLPSISSWNSQDYTKTDNELGLRSVQYNPLLRPEDDQSTDEETDRSSQSSADEYFSQTSESAVNSSPPSKAEDDQTTPGAQCAPTKSYNVSHSADAVHGPPQTVHKSSIAIQHSIPKVNRACFGRTKENEGSRITTALSGTQQYTHGVPIRTRPSSLQCSNLAGGLQLDTSTVAADVQRSRMRPQEKIADELLTNPRRNRSVCPKAMPPRLRRDTDQTDAIVKMIVTFCTNLINSIWSTTKEAGMPTQQPGPNVLPLQVFITETLRRSKTSYSTLQIALFYLILLKQCLPANSSRQAQGCRAMHCGRRMFLTALILASKYLQDRNYSARAWSKISGLPLKEINENERRYLSIVCWDLHVPKDTFENWSKIVLNVCRLSNVQEAADQKCDAFVLPKGGPGGHAFAVNASMEESLVGLRNWWLSTLKSLNTDIVKCPVQTERYVGSIVAFRQSSYLPRPVLDHPWQSEAAEAAFAQQIQPNKTLPRLPSMDTISRHFHTGENDSPASMTVGKMLANLPTPQQTPHATDMASMWTPQIPSRGPRCANSASVLGKLDQTRCPMATLSTCPPPPPKGVLKPITSCWRQFQARQTTNAADRSLTSSPESVISEVSVFSFPPRSRSSSMSSTVSSANSIVSSASTQAFAPDLGYNEATPQRLSQHQPTFSHSQTLHPPARRQQCATSSNDPTCTRTGSAATSSRLVTPSASSLSTSDIPNQLDLNTAYSMDLSPDSLVCPDLADETDNRSSNNQTPVQNFPPSKKLASDEARLALHASWQKHQRQDFRSVDELHRERPTLYRSTTQLPATSSIPEPNSFLKRSRSDSSEKLSTNAECNLASLGSKTGTSAYSSNMANLSCPFGTLAKETVHTTGLSSANRTPVPTTASQNKRMALQISDYASQFELRPCFSEVLSQG